MNVIEAGVLLGTLSMNDEEIKASWRKQCSRWHPDRGGDHEAMQRINAARAYLLGMSPESRRQEKKSLARQIGAIMDDVWEEVEAWEARCVTNNRQTSGDSSVINTKQGQEPVTTSRRAAGWEARNKEKVREQTRKRVKMHRDKNPDGYREYMREYMRKRRKQAL